jgi:DeoR/GlpR family transcriptional regulator of sugar metabolism
MVLSPDERLRQIRELLVAERKVTVAHVSRRFQVSEVTARHDLDVLADQGAAIRMRGGAVSRDGASFELAFEVRLRRQHREKLVIAKYAAALVEEGEVVALDGSTTSYHIALELKARRELVVITNSLRLANVFLEAPRITVIVTGGVLRHAVSSLVGELGEMALSRTRIGKGFFGARGMVLGEGLTELNSDETRLKQAMVRACTEVIGVVDHTKWRRAGFLTFAQADQISRLITDQGAPPDLVAAWRAGGVRVDIAGLTRRRAGRRGPRSAASANHD